MVEEGTESVNRTTLASIAEIRQSAESMKASVGNVHDRHRRKTARMGDTDVPDHNRALEFFAHNHLQAIQSAGDTAVSQVAKEHACHTERLGSLEEMTQQVYLSMSSHVKRLQQNVDGC